MNFSQDSIDNMNSLVDKITDETDPQSPSTSAETPGAVGGAKPKRTNSNCTRNKKKDEPGSKGKCDTSSNLGLPDTLTKSLAKQNYLIECIRNMINTTITSAVESSALSIRGELKSMKSSFDFQLKQISEKETRHHLETSVKVKEDLSTFTEKLYSLD